MDLIIFPEGTTTNGKGLINFKRGAFIMDSPLKIRILKYNGKITPNFVGITMMDSLIGILCNLKNDITLYKLDKAITKGKTMDWEEYSKEVKTLMCYEFGLHYYESDFYDSKETDKLIFGNKFENEY